MALAPQITNVGTNGSDARYDVSGLTPNENGRLTDGVYEYDSNGLDLSGRPADHIDGLPAANEIGGFQWNGSQWVGAGDGGGGGGSAGDLTASPYYQQYQSQIQAAQAADLSNVKSALQQLLIQWGMVPEGFQDKYGALDDTIKQLIQKNTDTGVSQYARLMESKSDAQRAAMANLAKRGLSRSGAKGYALRRGGLDFNRAMSDALSGVLGNANQLQGGYAQRELERQSGLSSLLAQLAASFRPSSFSYRGGGGGYVPAVPQVQAQAPAPAAPAPWEDANPNNVWTGNTIGGGETQGGYGTAYGPASPTQGGGFTSPQKPLIY